MQSTLRGAIRKAGFSLAVGMGLLGVLGTGCETPQDTNDAGTGLKAMGLLGAISGKISPLGSGLLDLAGDNFQKDAVLENQNQNTDRIVGSIEGQRGGNLGVGGNPPTKYEGEGYVTVGFSPGYGATMVSCTDTRDFNKNGDIDFPDEFIGMKSKFERNTPVRLILCLPYRCRAGNLKMELIGPTGRVIYNTDNDEVIRHSADQTTTGLKMDYPAGFDITGVYSWATYLLVDNSERFVGKLEFRVVDGANGDGKYVIGK